MISQTAEYALRVVWTLAQTGAPLTTPQLAAVTRVPAGYLSKVLKTLGRVGIVRAQRGLGGGFLLQRDPKELTIVSILDAVEPVHHVRNYPLGRATNDVDRCPLHRRIEQARAAAEAVLVASTFADLLAETTTAAPPYERVQAVPNSRDEPAAPATRLSRPKVARECVKGRPTPVTYDAPPHVAEAGPCVVLLPCSFKEADSRQDRGKHRGPPVEKTSRQAQVQRTRPLGEPSGVAAGLAFALVSVLASRLVSEQPCSASDSPATGSHRRRGVPP